MGPLQSPMAVIQNQINEAPSVMVTIRGKPRESLCPDTKAYDAGLCRWPRCGCPDAAAGNPTSDRIRAVAESQTTLEPDWDGVFRTHRNGALEEAASVCAEAAIRLHSNGKAQVNQVDRHIAEVLRSMERKILELRDLS